MNVRAGSLPTDAGATLDRYYRWHAPIYDLTRWTFLFGRTALLRRLAEGPAPRHLLEVGCGTGRNLARLAWRFPSTHLTGVDLSDAMLARAASGLHRHGTRVRCLHLRFDAPLWLDPPCDVMLFSYALTMMNPGWEQAVEAAVAQLPPGGRIAVVDFGGTPWPWFRRWMACNHVRLEDHLLPRLHACFRPDFTEVRQAYRGAWTYFLFVGSALGPKARRDGDQPTGPGSREAPACRENRCHFPPKSVGGCTATRRSPGRSGPGTDSRKGR